MVAAAGIEGAADTEAAVHILATAAAADMLVGRTGNSAGVALDHTGL